MKRTHRVTTIVLVILLASATLCVAQTDTQSQQPQNTQPTQTTSQTQPQTPVLLNGTELQVRMNQAISSDKAQVGQRFTGVVAVPLTVNSNTSFPVGSLVEGRILSIKDSGRMSNPGEMELVIDTLRYGNMFATLNSNPATVKGGSHTGSNVGKTAAGAGIGAVLGVIIGGGRGAAIGAGAGGAAGAGTAAATGLKPAKVAAEDILKFVLATDSVVVGVPGYPNSVPAYGMPNDIGANASQPYPQQGQAAPGQAPPNQSQSGNYPPNMSGDPNAQNQQSQYPQGQSTSPPTYGNSEPTLERRTPINGPPPPYGNSVPASSGGDNNAGPGLSRPPTASTFSPEMKNDIQRCISTNADSVPASYLKREYGAPPNGYARGDILTSDQMARAKPLPEVCSSTTQGLPSIRTVAVLNGQVLLLNSVHRVLDSFKLDVN